MDTSAWDSAKSFFSHDAKPVLPLLHLLLPTSLLSCLLGHSVVVAASYYLKNGAKTSQKQQRKPFPCPHTPFQLPLPHEPRGNLLKACVLCLCFAAPASLVHPIHQSPQSLLFTRGLRRESPVTHSAGNHWVLSPYSLSTMVS